MEREREREREEEGEGGGGSEEDVARGVSGAKSGVRTTFHLPVISCGYIYLECHFLLVSFCSLQIFYYYMKVQVYSTLHA